MKFLKTILLAVFLISALSIHSQAKDDLPLAELLPDTSTTGTCQGFGPQTPRDIDNVTGNNKRIFALAPEHKK